ncbi:two-component system sensor histidine kinase CreC [Undibacterium sp. CY18W]|uniref:histidine kinase n=1 Tax=Undibacterium hunanense TaxID=2762292 RepID=A0ABR6ZQ23_9BURK|nr:two-component system sensor histidine kinase CreC [Undibacterium hunanense]MBC3917633.1 two-component system sensor histidine kinase CreC [Undibacterium hunanense]
MKIGLRILLGYFLILGLTAWLVLNVVVEEIKPGVRATLEDTLIDTAQMLATLVAEDVANGNTSDSTLMKRLQNYAQRSIDVNISGVRKNSLDYRVYITNDKGIVVFDSDGRDVGKDYSRWNDVYRTLQGQYGARSTRADPDSDASSVMHVAAPIMDHGHIIGSLTVAKAISTINPFVQRSQRKILQRSAWMLLGSLLIGIAFSWWLNQALRKLQRYASSVEKGEKASLPALGNNEIGMLGRALESMRDRLEGKQYVEQLMHTLAHELKSPIASIQGSAELMREDMPAADRQRFLQNILEQNQRQKQLIDKLLALVKLEKQQSLEHAETIQVPTLLQQCAQDVQAGLQIKKLALEIDTSAIATNHGIMGDALLLRQAIGNLLDNAIDFAPAGSTIRMCALVHGQQLQISIQDQGPGIPDYAQDKIFDRFYSLPRPTAAKSTGLGLPFVREVALLHQGSASVNNLTGGGTCACLNLPL